MKMMKLNGTIVNTNGIDKKVLDDIVENIYRYDFPNTLAEYLDM